MVSGKLSNILENTADNDLKKFLYNLDTALDRIQNMEERRKDINNLSDSIETILQNFGNPVS